MNAAIFHWYAPLLIFPRSWLRSYAEITGYNLANNLIYISYLLLDHLYRLKIAREPELTLAERQIQWGKNQTRNHLEQHFVFVYVYRLDRRNAAEQGLHCCERKIIKSSALALQFIINLLFFKIGGNFGALHLFITLLIIFQYDFWLVLGLILGRLAACFLNTLLEWHLVCDIHKGVKNILRSTRTSPLISLYIMIMSPRLLLISLHRIYPLTYTNFVARLWTDSTISILFCKRVHKSGYYTPNELAWFLHHVYNKFVYDA